MSAEAQKAWRERNPEKARSGWDRWNKQWRERNPEKAKATRNKAHRAFRLAHPEKVHAKDRRRTLRQYGLTPEGWAARFEAQGRACASCGFTLSKQWNVDHNHVTGETRGILCTGCNVALGYLENETRNARLRAYLEKQRWRLV